MRYRIELTPDDNGTMLVTSPDFPELTTFGTDEADALLRARDALTTVLAARIEDREPIPKGNARGSRSVAVPALVSAKVALCQAMAEDGVHKAELARRLGCFPPQIDRLLALRHASRFDQIEAAFRALGRELTIDIGRAA